VPILLLLLANAVWGSSYVVAKVALEEIPPPLLAALRFTLAGAVLWLILASRRSSLKLPTPGDACRLLALGLVGIGMNGLLGYWGVSLTTATDAALLIVGEVLFTTLLAIALIGEHLTRARSLGLLVGVLGVIVLIAGGAVAQPTPEAPARALGDLLILAGLAFESLHTVLGTRLSQRYDALTVLTLTVSGSCLIWLPLIGIFAQQSGLHLPSPQASVGVLYLAGVTSVACYLVWFAVLRRGGATLGALSLLAQPVVGALLGILLLGDLLTGSTLLGGAFVLACLVLASLPARSTGPQKTAASTFTTAE
jgi:drug/metabolite transporter (DMT)-like permease